MSPLLKHGVGASQTFSAFEESVLKVLRIGALWIGWNVRETNTQNWWQNLIKVGDEISLLILFVRDCCWSNLLIYFSSLLIKVSTGASSFTISIHSGIPCVIHTQMSTQHCAFKPPRYFTIQVVSKWLVDSTCRWSSLTIKKFVLWTR